MPYSIYDMHTHILPHMDDGAESRKMSFEMLKELKRQGVERVYATPHFLFEKETVESFLTRRDAAFGALTEYLKEQDDADIPSIHLGAEIRVARGICETDIASLCYEGSGALLLELPMEKLSKQILTEIRSICDRGCHIPVLAHLDRYTWFDRSDIDSLCELPDAVFQFNTKALSTFSGRRLISRVQKNGCRVLFGSDCHNTEQRPPDIHLLTGEGKRSPLSKGAREGYISEHESSTDHILSAHFSANNGLIF